jgi:hypothetical protein
MTHQDECPAINDLTAQRPARLCAAILDRRDTVPAPPFSTAVNTIAVEGVVAVAAVDGEEACGPRGEVIRERGDERHGGEHGPGFEGFEPEAMEAVERSRAAACAAGWGLRGKQASEASEWGSRPMAAGRHGGNPGGWGGRRESDARSQASHGRGGEYENGGAGGVKSPRMRNG